MNKKSGIMLLVVLGLVALTGGFLSYWKTHQTMGKPGVRLVEDPEAEKPPVRLPDWVLEYTGKDLEITVAEREALPPDTTITRRRFTHPNGFFIDITVVLMGLDRTSIHKPQYCLTGAGFQIQESLPVTIDMSHPVNYALPAMRIKSTKLIQGEKYSGLLYYWFVDEQHVTEQHYERMWLMAKDLFASGQMQRWAYVTVSAFSVPGNEEEVFKHMKLFIRSAVPVFQSTLPPGIDWENPSPGEAIP
jgi:hypothetical protein